MRPRRQRRARARPSPSSALPGIVATHDVVGHAQHVEAVPPVQVDELGHRQRAVAPARVGVELAEQRAGSASHHRHRERAVARTVEKSGCISREKDATPVPRRAGMLAPRGLAGRRCGREAPAARPRPQPRVVGLERRGDRRERAAPRGGRARLLRRARGPRSSSTRSRPSSATAATLPASAVSSCCTLMMLPHQIPDALRVAHRRARGRRRVEVLAPPRGSSRGREVDDNEIKRILRESDDSDERREAWEASKKVGAEVADDVRELARLRNEAARSLGYRDWFALSLAVDEVDEDKLWQTLAEADRATAEPFARWKGALDAVSPSGSGAPSTSYGRGTTPTRSSRRRRPRARSISTRTSRARTSSALARRTFEGIELEVEEILARSDLFPRDGKNQHAFCIDVDRAGDVRVLANVVDNQTGRTRCSTSSGTASTTSGSTTELPWLLRDTHLVTTEASALLFGALAGDREWLEQILGLDAGEAEALEGRLRAARAAELLVFTRWVLVMTGFERVLYGDPDGDLDARLVGARRAAPAPHAAGGPRRAGLGLEDPHRGRAGLLPHVPLRRDRRAPAPGRARRRGRRHRRPSLRRRAAPAQALRPGRVGPLGPARGGRVRLAALGRVARSRGLGGRSGRLEAARRARLLRLDPLPVLAPRHPHLDHDGPFRPDANLVRHVGRDAPGVAAGERRASRRRRASRTSRRRGSRPARCRARARARASPGRARPERA